MEFEKVGLFLLEEEQRLLQALKTEDEEVGARLRESSATLERQGHSLEMLLLQLEDKNQHSPLQMLQVRGRPALWGEESPQYTCSLGVWRVLSAPAPWEGVLCTPAPWVVGVSSVHLLTWGRGDPRTPAHLGGETSGPLLTWGGGETSATLLTWGSGDFSTPAPGGAGGPQDT